ncbi:aldehyde dehydrogenase family protein, partial [Vibrio splendidus]
MKLLDSSLLKQNCYIAGQWVAAEDGATVPVCNPSTGDIIAYVPELGKKDTLLAIAAAEQAQKLWKKKTAKERSVVLKNWHQLIIDNTDDLASILTTEQGKPFLEAKGEIGYAASFIEWFAEE